MRAENHVISIGVSSCVQEYSHGGVSAISENPIGSIE